MRHFAFLERLECHNGSKEISSVSWHIFDEIVGYSQKSRVGFFEQVVFEEDNLSLCEQFENLS